jgi:hypothetical protein
VYHYFCLTLLTVTALAAHQYQSGSIVKVELQESHTSSGGTGAPMKANVSSYHVSIQLGDKIYVWNYNAHSDHDSRGLRARMSKPASAAMPYM